MKLKILLVTDGRYPEYVNGVSIYIRYLSEAMAGSGQDVHIFHHIRSGFLKGPRITRERKGGITYHGLDHSPMSFSEAIIHPQKSCCEEKTERIFTDLLEEIDPDIVHFHEFHRTPSNCIHICHARHIPTLVTLHDYWFICPRTQLFTLDESLCEGPDEGKNCVVNCLAGDFMTRQYRKMTTLLPDAYPIRCIRHLRNMYKRIRGEHLGQTSFDPEIKKRDGYPKNERLIEAFRSRDARNRLALLKADLILAVSTSVKEIFVKHGIDRERIVVNQLGVKSVEWIRKRVRSFAHYPVRFGFLGHLGPLKGVQLVIQAARSLPPEKAEFLIFGGGSDETLHDFKMGIKDMSHCKYMGRYDYERLDDIFDAFDLLIIPSICRETLGMIGLEAQAAGIPVIASDIGGMRDYITHGLNGLLFQVGDVNALKRQIHTILDSPQRIEEMSRHAIQPKTIEQNSQELIGYYKSIKMPSPDKSQKSLVLC
ncbi:MAG: glycosyltransferase [bacterium]